MNDEHCIGIQMNIIPCSNKTWSKRLYMICSNETYTPFCNGFCFLSMEWMMTRNSEEYSLLQCSYWMYWKANINVGLLIFIAALFLLLAALVLIYHWNKACWYLFEITLRAPWVQMFTLSSWGTTTIDTTKIINLLKTRKCTCTKSNNKILHVEQWKWGF